MHDESPRSTWKLAIIKGFITGKEGLTHMCSQDQDTSGKTNYLIANLIPQEVSTTITDQLNRGHTSSEGYTESKGYNRKMAMEDSCLERKRKSHELGQAAWCPPPSPKDVIA